jgi:ABC-type proline/glycine betaine transport system permease subunit
MGRFVRVVSVAFASFSVLFWISVQGVVSVLDQVRGVSEQSKWDIWLTGSLPAILYAVVCVFVFHWFARKIIKKVQKTDND